MRDFAVFRNRLSKNFRHLRKWAARQGIECFRLYDRDVPEFPVIVELYGEFAQIAEYETHWQMSDEDWQLWRAAILQTVSEVLNIDAQNIAYKFRQKQKGKDQYEKQSTPHQDFLVLENQHKFYINLFDYLDTGLFLDHRPMRARIQKEAAGKRFLNLFAYTGSFTVYAAAGGAASTTTVDLSNTYLNWAQKNLAVNDLAGEQHVFVRADILTWLREAKAEFDLVMMDPPSFSNSKKMQNILDVQRDHADLIRGVMRLLAPAGMLYFSNNRRGFKLDAALSEDFAIQDISHFSVPEDFRNKKIHQCFQIQHKI